jgi:hypothetical protein
MHASLITVWILYDRECSLAVLFTVFNVEIMHLGILIMSGKGGVYADEDHKDKKERKIVCLLEKCWVS